MIAGGRGKQLIMAYLLGEKVEDVMCNTTKGVTGLYDYIGDHWCCLFAHPGEKLAHF